MKTHVIVFQSKEHAYVSLWSLIETKSFLFVLKTPLFASSLLILFQSVKISYDLTLETTDFRYAQNQYFCVKDIILCQRLPFIINRVNKHPVMPEGDRQKVFMQSNCGESLHILDSVLQLVRTRNSQVRAY